MRRVASVKRINSLLGKAVPIVTIESLTIQGTDGPCAVPVARLDDALRIMYACPETAALLQEGRAEVAESAQYPNWVPRG